MLAYPRFLGTLHPRVENCPSPNRRGTTPSVITVMGIPSIFRDNSLVKVHAHVSPLHGVLRGYNGFSAPSTSKAKSRSVGLVWAYTSIWQTKKDTPTMQSQHRLCVVSVSFDFLSAALTYNSTIPKSCCRCQPNAINNSEKI